MRTQPSSFENIDELRDDPRFSFRTYHLEEYEILVADHLPGHGAVLNSMNGPITYDDPTYSILVVREGHHEIYGLHSLIVLSDLDELLESDDQRELLLEQLRALEHYQEEYEDEEADETVDHIQEMLDDMLVF